MLSVAPHTSVLVIASKIIVRRRISMLPTYLKNSISLKNISSNQFFSNFFLKKSYFHDIFAKICQTKFSHYEYQSAEKREIFSHLQKISSNQLFSNFFSKTIAFTKLLRKKCERKFMQFPHCEYGNDTETHCEKI